MKPLSEQLANLSVRAKQAEDAAAAAQKEAHDKVVASVAQAQASAEQAVQKVNQNIKSASDTASAKWNGMKAKIVADMDDLKSLLSEAAAVLGWYRSLRLGASLVTRTKGAWSHRSALRCRTSSSGKASTVFAKSRKIFANSA